MITKNKTNTTSCVYDSFQDAGLPTTPEMMKGMYSKEVFSLLEDSGYSVFVKKDKKHLFVELPESDEEGFFIMRSWDGQDHHLEHHQGIELVQSYEPKTICMIAIKRA